MSFPKQYPWLIRPPIATAIEAQPDVIEVEFSATRTGKTLDIYEEEVGIPDVGQHIDERCVRAEFEDGILLCPQPDGRIVTLRGDPIAEGSTATYARPAQ